MKTFGFVLATGALGWLGIATPVARAQDTITTVVGRGIGDGRAATAASLDEPTGVTLAADGAILIADSRHERVRRVDPATGVITTFAGTLGGFGGDGEPPDRIALRRPVRVLIAGNGDVLIVERDNDRIRRIRQDTGLAETVAVGANIPGFALVAPNDADVDAAGNLYVADFEGHRVLQVSPLGVTTTFAGTGVPGFTGDGGPAAGAQLQFPACVVAAPGNVVYVCDKGNHRIRRVQGGTITTVAGTGVPGFTGDGAGPTVALNEPEDAALLGNRLVFSDQANHRLRELDLSNGTVTTLAGTGPNQFAGENAPAATSTLASPMGVAIAADGRIFFTERSAHRVRVLADGVINTVAGDGVSRFGGDGGPALDATFRTIEGVTQDAAGNLYVTDTGNHRVRKVDAATGTVSTIAGNGTTTFGVDGVPATVVGLDSPSDVLVDAAGTVIFSDTRHHRIRAVTPDGLISTIVGNGVPGFAGDGGPAVAAQINMPTGLAFDAAGALYIADFGNHRIRKVDAAGNISTLAGDGNGGFNGDGPAGAVSLNNPTDVAFDAAGNVLIADMRNHRVRRLDVASGTLTTIAGTGEAGSSDDFLPAVTAALRLPTDVSVDADGNVLLVDSGSHRIRRVSPQGVIDTVIGSRVPGDSGDGGAPLEARLLTPLRMFRTPGGRLLIVDRENHRIRAVGQDTGGGGGGGGDPDCTQGTCSAGGGPKKTDCFLEFNSGLGSGNRITCRDGDPACDLDEVPRQCTVRVRVCLAVADPRLGRCTPAPVTAVQVVKPSGDGAAPLLAALGGMQAASVGGGPKPVVSFGEAATGCAAPSDVVVAMKRRSGKVAIRTIASTGTGRGTRDPDRLTVVCVQ